MRCIQDILELVMYLRFKKASEVRHFHFEMSNLIFPVSTPTKMPINYNLHNNSHFLLLQDYFPAVANWLKLISYTCTVAVDLNMKSIHNTVLICPIHNHLFPIGTQSEALVTVVLGMTLLQVTE